MSNDFSSVLRNGAEGQGLLPHPFQATLNITGRCNSNCIYCSYGRRNSPPTSDLPFQTLETIIRNLAQFGVRSLSLSGGEPMLRLDLPDLVRTARDVGMVVTMTTNAVLLDSMIVEALSVAGLSNLVISLDTRESVIYRELRQIRIDRPVQAFRKMQEHRLIIRSIPRVVVNAVISRANFSLILELLDWLRPWLLTNDAFMVQAYQPPANLPAAEDHLRFSPADLPKLESLCSEIIRRKAAGWPVGNDAEFLQRLPGFLAEGKLPAGYQCLTAYSSIFIKENLDVHPCWQLPAVGNIGRTDIAALWSSPEMTTARSQMQGLNCRKCALVCHAPEFKDTVSHEPLLHV